MKFFEKVRANTSPPIDVNIDNNMLAHNNNMLAHIFSPFFFKKNSEFSMFYFISSGMRLKTKRNWGQHNQSWELLNEALEKNSPKLGMIASWGIFEKEAKLKFGKWRLSSGLIEETTKLLKLDKIDNKKLIKIKRKRNKLAHSGSENTSWLEVDRILEIALKLHMKS